MFTWSLNSNSTGRCLVCISSLDRHIAVYDVVNNVRSLESMRFSILNRIVQNTHVVRSEGAQSAVAFLRALANKTLDPKHDEMASVYWHKFVSRIWRCAFTQFVSVYAISLRPTSHTQVSWLVHDLKAPRNALEPYPGGVAAVDQVEKSSWYDWVVLLQLFDMHM